ncbi:MAG: SDR family oxidoreductase [Rhodoferax sp.]|uniref:SDR family oxidoreductase n=1 Tax=Rhodoferax sp. TaxID=50421 RepID=UPI00260CB6AF|nr:SDR family oxidoreductase [Rhodoferax sp.]MDD5336425.1 SDR family oxidoreductase [Rhodoferax sp.]
MMRRRNFQGQVVLISGAAGGLGAALCRRYGVAGSLIAAMDLDAARLDALVRTLAQSGAQALALPGDITDPVACKMAVAATLAHFGRLDGLINNAGISHRSLLRDTDPGVIRRVMEVNFFGALHLTHAALPHVTAQRGFIVAISSVAGFSPLVGRTGYAASKHALLGFFDSLRCEVEASGVSVTLVCPSFIRTGIGAAGLGGDGSTVSSPRITSGGESTAEDIAQRIFVAVAGNRRFLLPDRTSRLAWWFSRLAPGLYARAMKRRLGVEFEALPR